MKKGRYWIALWLVFVLGTLLWVNGRQTSSVVLAGEARDLEAVRSALEAIKAEQQGRIREATSRNVIVPKAEGMGLRFPADSEIVILEMPRGHS